MTLWPRKLKRKHTSCLRYHNIKENLTHWGAWTFAELYIRSYHSSKMQYYTSSGELCRPWAYLHRLQILVSVTNSSIWEIGSSDLPDYLWIIKNWQKLYGRVGIDILPYGLTYGRLHLPKYRDTLSFVSAKTMRWTFYNFISNTILIRWHNTLIQNKNYSIQTSYFVSFINRNKIIEVSRVNTLQKVYLR